MKRGLAALAMLGSAALALAAGLTPAQASALGWRVVQVYDETEFDSLSATSVSSAIAAGEQCGHPCGVESLLVRQWNGSTWQRIASPPGSRINVFKSVTAASSPSDEWVFTDATKVNSNMYYSAPLHWNGMAWTVSPRLIGVQANAAVAPSAGDAWVFGLVISPQVGYVAHYNGTAWSHMPFPIETAAASASSASDIWAVGNTLTSDTPVTMHWNGSTWATVPLPHIHLPPGQTYVFAGVTDITPDNVWTDAYPWTGFGVAPGNVLLHWNGTAWARVKVPLPLNQPEAITADGHGGIWMFGYKSATSARSASFYHNRGGRWSRTLVPSTSKHITQLNSLSLVPGTQSVWAAGSILLPGVQQGIGQGGILKFGP
ncbi:MAG TPA: hypothetical protein VGS19_10705 [Streptosporangiaceae bacterium]|nr:hypothetical protein [Streptosporangiaceae bacterium]